MGEAVKHIAWAYAAWTLAIVVRLWAVPFFVAVDEWSVQQRLTTQTGTRRVERLFVHERWV
jgi:hypothetical protein